MTLDAGFILAAGKGRRMGELGEHLPKPLWPVFDCSLFELSVRQLKELGVLRIYANTHHCAKLVESYVSSKKLNVELLYEKELLGSGGAFHNLKSKSDEHSVLAVNSDCLYFFDDKIIKKFETTDHLKQHLLFGQKVNRADAYNEWITEEGKLIRIAGPSNEQRYWTFSGVSLINLDLIKYVQGESSFFQTVATTNQGESCVVEEEFLIQDYGTVDLYEKSIWQTFKDERLMDRLIELGAISCNNLQAEKQSYRSTSEQVLNFTPKAIKYTLPGIYIEVKNIVYRLWEGEVSQLSFESA
jgi:mannose-1-phosphate guanylyltransferase